MNKVYLPLIVCFIAATNLFSQSLNIYVSPTGTDTGYRASTANAVSLTRAKAVAKLAANKKSACDIWLMDGVYTYLALDSTDTRTATAPVTYHSLNRLKASFQPVTLINPSDLMAIPDSIKNRIVDSVAQTKVMQVDLSKYNLSNMNQWPGYFEYPVTVTATGSTRQSWPLLYQNTTPLPMAQYPKGDSVMRMKTVLVNGSSSGKVDTAGVFKYRDGRCKYWGQAIKDGLWLRGSWRVAWQMDFIKTDSIDLVDSIVYQSVGVPGGIGSKYSRPAGNGQEPYVAVNLVEEISLPGEWAINFTTKTLYIYPPDSGTLNISSNSTTPTISLSNVNYTNFDGITLDGGSGIGIKLSGCSNVTIAGMEIMHLSSYGVLIADGNNCTARSNDIHDVGEGGVYVISSTYNADQLILKYCNHKIINNHIYNYAQDVFLYAAAIDTRDAIGCYGAYNKIHGCPHVGILFGGNNNVFEYNEISDVVTTYNDMGAFYTSESTSKRGSIIRNNYVHAMNYCGSALYADDNSQGTTFNGNIAVNCLYGVQNNYGLFNRYNDNIYFNNYKDQCTYDIGADTVSTSSNYKAVEAVYNKSTIYQNAYPELKDYIPTVNYAYASSIWTQINGCTFLGTSVSGGRCLNFVADSVLFLSNGNTNTKYAVSGSGFTINKLICNNNFYAKPSLLNAPYSNTLDSLKATGIFSKTAITNWHIDRIGLFKDSIYRSDITQTQTQGVSPTFNVQIASLHSFISPDTLNITVTIKNPNIDSCYSNILLYDSNKANMSVPFTLTKASFDSIVLIAQWANPIVGKHLISVHLLDSTLWNFASDSSLITIIEGLPVTISSFNATAQKNTVSTNWHTENELNTSYFNIQHSTDGSSFTSIGTLKAIGSGSNSYQLTDYKPTNGTNYYRLESVDKDGASNYSKVVSCELSVVSKQLIVYPNPAKDNVTISGNHIASVQVIDNMGRVVKIVSLKDATNPSLSVSGLVAGVYHLRIQNTDGNVSGVGFVVN
jgi:hypothetical protein